MTCEVIDQPLTANDHGGTVEEAMTAQGRIVTDSDPSFEKELAMSTISPSPLLRQAFMADAATSAALGLLMLLAAGPMAPALGLPVPLLRASGIVLLPYAALVGYLGLRDRLPRVIVWAVVIGNAIWATDSLLLLLSGWMEPTRAGIVFVVAQGLAVLMYAELQFIGLRRSEKARAAP